MITMRGKTLKVVVFILSIFFAESIVGQQLDFENIGRGKPFKVSGNIAANSVFYSSNQNSARAPFTYFLQGSLNFNIYEFSIPVSYSFSNQGDNLEYQLPFSFNRLSLHPKYRWIQAHIGDVSMSFSPYTLAGHQFTGGGVDLTPKGSFTFSAMYGRLLKATEDSEDNRTQPAFKRMGYGAKVGFKKERYSLELIGFYAKDKINSISAVPEEKKVLPKENLVLSMSGSVTVTDGLRFKGEYASTAITQDLRAERVDHSSGIAGLLFNNRASTEHYKAFKTEMEYSFDKYRFGVGYERIDPGYQTLGAYYFNNDFENITLNGNTTLFNNKISLGFNIGYQRDDLANQKETNTSRTVGSINATYAMNKKVNITGSYSNFSTYTNNKLDQFEIINDDNLLDNQAERFNYKQLSQNANVNVSYILENSKNRRQNLNTNYSLATVANAENGIVRIGNGSTFHNFNTSYTLGLPQRKINITSALNTTYNTIGRDEAYTWGPTVAVNKKFLKDKLNTTFSTSYNQNNSKTNKTSATNFRLNTNYVYREKHNFNLSAIQLFRNTSLKNTQDLTVTFGYNYAFDLSAKKKAKEERTRGVFSFSYKEHMFKGEPHEITPEVLIIGKAKRFEEIKKINKIGDKLLVLEQELKDAELKSKNKYKKKAIEYLSHLHKNQDYVNTYYDLAFDGLKKLYRDAKRAEWSVEQKYKTALSMYNKSSKKENKKMQLFLNKRKSAYKANKYMLEQLENLKKEDLYKEGGDFYNFKHTHLNTILKMLEEGKTNMEVSIFLEIAFAKMFHTLSE
ncbi:outer membrane beta-barrel family protein [Tenacibaculum discolor]|uniref:Outer membrane beta-barrel family protein n=2 Tax=Tenacibaculum discolor TaxID=361581 RepID=A0ABT9F5U4_9FLAO|nr:outer membrane beta-barrel family protein [Tenacibaculum discolor]MDP2542090.1 outer membrane beta-barrel family protein [Tenacibaculum discolor]